MRTVCSGRVDTACPLHGCSLVRRLSVSQRVGQSWGIGGVSCVGPWERWLVLRRSGKAAAFAEGCVSLAPRPLGMYHCVVWSDFTDTVPCPPKLVQDKSTLEHVMSVDVLFWATRTVTHMWLSVAFARSRGARSCSTPPTPIKKCISPILLCPSCPALPCPALYGTTRSRAAPLLHCS